MTGPRIGDLGAGTIWPRLRQALKTSALVLYGIAAASGALFSPLISVALGVTFAVTGAAVVALLHQCPADDLPPPPHPLAAGAALACLPAAIAGISTLGAPSGLGVGLGLVLAILLGGHWFDPPPERPPSSATVVSEPPGDERSLRDLLRACRPICSSTSGGASTSTRFRPVARPRSTSGCATC